MVAGCGTGSGEQAGKKKASTGPEAAKFEMSKPGKIGVSTEGSKGFAVSMMNADGSGLTAIHGELATATSLDWQSVGRHRSR